MNTHPGVSTEIRDNVAIVTLDDGKANALSSPFMSAASDALSAAARTSGAVVVVGRQGFFSGGLDIKLMPTLSHLERCEMVRDLGKLLLTAFLLPRPLVAAVSGHALGGGCLLALAADVRIAADAKLKFGLNEVGIGVPVPSFGVEIARASIPSQWLIEAALHATVYTPQEAHARGIIESLHTPDTLLEAARTRAAKIATFAGGAYEATKRRIREQAVSNVQSGLDQEIEGFLSSFNT
jgi:enoyl-CoA hydratase